MRDSSILVSHHKQSLAFLSLQLDLSFPGFFVPRSNATSNCTPVPCKISYVCNVLRYVSLSSIDIIVTARGQTQSAPNTPNQCSDSHRFHGLHGFLQLLCPRESSITIGFSFFLFVIFRFCVFVDHCNCCYNIARETSVFMPPNSFRIYFDVLFSLSQRSQYQMSNESFHKLFSSVFATNNR